MAKSKKAKVVKTKPADKPKNKYEFEFPYWSNKEASHIIASIIYPNGTRTTASIQDKDGSNPDYKRIMEEFGEEVIDKNTADGLKRRDENIKKRMERRESQAARARQEMLFNSKLESFEIANVKASKNTEMKRLIRKGKTPMEVGAYTTILLLEDFFKDKEVDELWDKVPNLMKALSEISKSVVVNEETSK